MIGEKCGYINKQGEIVIPLIYDDASSFINGRAYVERDDMSFYIDKKGEVI